nr:zinc finger, CCHC-type [Tanacetum cinerariifolium]
MKMLCLQDWIIDSGGSYHITYMRDYLVNFEEYDGGNILFGDGRECRVQGTGKVQVQMRDGSSFVLDNVMYILELRRNLISLGTLEKEGFTRSTQQCTKSGVAKHLGVAGLQQQDRGYNHVYISSEQGHYHQRLDLTPIDMLGTGLVQVLQGVDFEVEPHEDHTFEVEPHGNFDHVAGLQKVQTQDLIYYHSARDREQHLAWELFSYKEDSNEAAFVVAAMEKIYAHESSTFNNTVACEVISMWKVGLKDDMDAQSDVYVLSNGCRKCNDDNNGYYWEYTPAKGNVLGMEIVRDQSGNTLRVSHSRFYNRKLVQTLLEGHFVLSLEGSLSGDCDVEKNAYMTLTEAANEAIWLKGLAIKSGFELNIVAGIATRALSKAVPGSRLQLELKLLRIEDF